MSDWKWWVGSSEEWMTTECGSREEALRVAKEEYEGGWVMEALDPQELQLSTFFDCSRFIEDAEERAEDYNTYEWGDHIIFDCSKEQEVDLEKMVRATIDEWQKKHNLNFRGNLFQSTRNQEYVEPPIF